MKTLTTQSGHTIEMYNTIHELPMKRSHEFTKYLGMDADIGSDIEGVGRHFERLFMFLGAGKEMKAEAQREAYNLYYQWFLVLENINPKYLSFACLIHSLDKEPCNDLTEDGLRALVNRLSEINLTEGEISTATEEVKKNLKQSVNYPFPTNSTE